MQSSYAKYVSLALLAVVLFMFSGLSALVSPPATSAPVKACCDACAKEKTRSSNACSTPDCPLYLCVSASAASPLSIPAPAAIGSVSSSVAIHSPHSAAKSVFHPPALV